jgi:hypothetical protein
MDDEIHIIQQHPFCLLVTLAVCDALSKLFQALVHGVCNRLNLSRIGPAAHHKIICESSGALFEFENGEFLCLSFLAGENGFVNLLFELFVCGHR